MTTRETQPPAWAKTPPPKDTPLAVCRVPDPWGEPCGAQYLDCDGGRLAHHAVYGHQPASGEQD
jgi:hypothetical protein